MSSVTELPHTNQALVYRQATPEDVPQIAEMLISRGLEWPGPAATPYVVDLNGESVVAMFKTLCFHVEPLVSKEGLDITFSVTELGKLIRASFEEFVDELGYPITIYSMVQDTPAAHAAALKNGLKRSTGVLYEITLRPAEPAGGEEHVPWGRGDRGGRDQGITDIEPQ